MTRPSWDQTWLDVAHTVAKRSLCSRAQVGAVIVDTTNRVVATGYNSPPAGWKHGSQPCSTWCKRTTSLTVEPDYSDCPSLHAETNAMMYSDRSLRLGGTIYVTSHMCWSCAKITANSGLSRVVVDDTSPAAHRNPMASYNFLLECGLEVVLTDQLMMSRLQRTSV